MHRIPILLVAGLCCQEVPLSAAATMAPLVRTVDLIVGEQATVELSDGSEAKVRLIGVKEKLDSVNGAVRRAEVTVEVNGKPATLVAATYNLPRKVGGVQIDCAVTKGYHTKGKPGSWGLKKDARLRLWPAGSPWIRPDSFVYPAKQKWFATDTQMANDPVYVDGGERPNRGSIYYHTGLDIGGSEGLVEIVSAVDALVVSAAGKTLPKHRMNTPVGPRYDVVYLLDDRGWYYRNSHLKTIDPAIKPGVRVKRGQRIGTLGKEGGSGGWTHLHFEVKSRQPSGEWGTQEGYAFLWQAYVAEHEPKVIAVARPHQLLWTGESVTLDGSKSWAAGKIAKYEWTFGDGTKAFGKKAKHTYNTPGRHSEILKVTDAKGNVAYDFAVVVVYDRKHPERHITTVHPNYYPSLGVRAGDPVTFKVRSFISGQSREGHETWNFGDGTAPLKVRSDGNAKKLDPKGYAETVHRFKTAGDYVVRAQRINEFGVVAAGHVWVHVEAR
jgi:murein DD-endopeptidase MepM/ murein hydrolase activator NlpD